MENEVFLSVIIPAYNEEENIVGTLAEISEYLSGREFPCEVIVVDDGSGDRTIEKTREAGNKLGSLRIIASSPNRGKGYVLRRGILEAKGRYVMFMDADNSTSIRELDKFLPYLEQGYDAVIGSRRLSGAEVTVSESPVRIFLGQIYIFLSKVMLGLNVSDFNCGFKAYSREAARKLYSMQKMDGWSFDTEVIFLIKKMGMRLKEVPVTWAHKFSSKVKPLSAGIDSFTSLVRVKWNDLFGSYGRKKGEARRG